MIGEVERPLARRDPTLMGLLGTALFWAWCLVWVSNAGDASWPIRSAGTFFAVRIMWVIGMTSFAVLMLRKRVAPNRRLMLLVASPAAALGTLAVVSITGHSGRDVFLLAVTSVLTGFAAGTLLPTWAPQFGIRHDIRLVVAYTTAALGAVAAFHLISLVPYAIGPVIFVALPLLSGALVLLDRSEPQPALEVVKTSRPGAYATPDIGYAIFGLVSGFTYGLNLLADRLAVRSPLAIALIGSAAVIALLAAAGLYALGTRKQTLADFSAVLPLVVAGVLTLPYVSINVGALLQAVVATNYLCSAMLFNLTLSDTTYEVKIGSATLHLSTRAIGASAGVLGALAGFWASYALDLRSPLVIGVFIAVAYTLLAGMSLIVSSRISIFGRTPSAPASASVPDVCADIARRYRLTPREKEILAILATGRNQAYIQRILVISPGTATTHIAHIYQKLGIHSRGEMLDLVEECRQMYADRAGGGS